MTERHAGKILIVDDEPNALRVLSAILGEAGFTVFTASDVTAAIRIVSETDPDVIVTDIKMPGRDGMQLFQHMKEKYPDIPLIFLTAYGSVDSAVDAVTCGAFYYFIKPPNYNKLKGILARAVEQRGVKRELAELRRRLHGESICRLTGSSQAIEKIIKTIDAVKDSSSSVLIIGETGTGKELIAQALHYGSIRRDRPFVAVNCAAIPRELLESELFGYEKGAFSGASSRRVGRFEEASDGTLFLDEIGELELSLQAKLLRVLQERELERLGSNKKIRVDFRLVSSTNRNMAAEIASGTFREDLFYRLNVVQINSPPLRDRIDDIPLLANEFLKEFSIKEQKSLVFSSEVLRIFTTYSWPGNIRQLRNVVERAVVLARKGRITSEHLPDELSELVLSKPEVMSTKTLREASQDAVRRAILEAHGNKSEAARLLGISRKALYKRLDDMGLET